MANPQEYVDTHFHIWELKRFKYVYPTEDLTTIYRDLTIDDYKSAIAETPVKYGVFIQVMTGDDAVTEADWLLELAKTNPVIKGIVVGFSLRDPKLPDILDKYCKMPLIKGVRNIVDLEDEDDWIVHEDVQRGINSLADRKLPVDLIFSPRHWPYITEVVRRNPNVQFVIDHLGKPVSGPETRAGWTEWIDRMAAFPNVHCKISSQYYAYRGPPTDAEKRGQFKDEDKYFVHHTLSVFGVDRCMFGSDWPPMLLTSPSYKFHVNTTHAFTQHLTPQEKDKFFRTNAIKFYKLDI